MRPALRRLPHIAVAAIAVWPVVASRAEPASSGQKPQVTSSSVVAQTRWLRLSTLRRARPRRRHHTASTPPTPPSAPPYSYTDASGKPRKWDMASRTTRPTSADVDGVAILALLRRGSSVETLLVEQFRPPMNTATLELPAGLIDAGETAVQAALRGVGALHPCIESHLSARLSGSTRPRPTAELREETGYIGVVRLTSGPLAMSPGLTDESIRLVVVDVDLDDPRNQSPKQALGDNGTLGWHRPARRRPSARRPRRVNPAARPPPCMRAEFIRVRRVPIRELEALLASSEAEGLVPFAGLQMLVAGLALSRECA